MLQQTYQIRVEREEFRCCLSLRQHQLLNKFGVTKGYLYRRGQNKSLQAIKVRNKIRSKSYLPPILRDSFDKIIDLVLPVQV